MLNRHLYFRGLLNCGLTVFDTVISGFFGRGTNTQLSKLDVLLIKHDAIGDFLLWLHAFSNIKKKFNSEEYAITLVVHPSCANLARELNLFDVIIEVDRIRFSTNLLYRFKIWQILLNKRWETTIYTNSSIEYSSAGSIIKYVISNQKIGVESDCAIDSRFWCKQIEQHYSKSIKVSSMDAHELTKNFEILSSIIGEIILPHTNYFKNLGWEIKPSETEYIVLFVGARLAYRSWPVKKWIELLNQWNPTQQIILAGTIQDVAAANLIKEACSNLSIENTCGSMSLRDTLILCKNAKIVLGNESAGIHMAAVWGTPSVCILGGGAFWTFCSLSNSSIYGICVCSYGLLRM